jgi:NAD(P)-dependent dehydrogenase (short-subunit alcohol dehydrogenase family)
MKSKHTNLEQVTADEWATCIKVLQLACDDPDTYAAAKDMKTLTGLVTKLYKFSRKQRRKLSEQSRRETNRVLLESSLRCQSEPLDELTIDRATQTLSVKQRRQLNRETNRVLLESSLRCQSEPLDELTMENATHAITQPTATYQKYNKFIRCYICKQKYNEIHFFYHNLCPSCAEYNYAKRQQRADLNGRVAFITGGRIKIGYETVLKLLRDGARVITTTRFPRDAAHRYAQEADFETWQHRLKIYGLDLINIPRVEEFIHHLLDSEPYIDIIINNAAQTVKKPMDFYAHLIAIETAPVAALPEKMQTLLGSYNNNLPSQQELTPDKAVLQPVLPTTPDFPAGKYDSHGQQIDLRSHNSWVTTLDNVDTVELLEVHLVNALSPFLFNSRLKPLLLSSPHPKRFIVNVSAMEGKFSYANKTPRHPHTNMAKAALNMMTRTSAKDYAQDNIFMNSVDTGWITQENPYPKKTRVRKNGFVPPLDIIDGTARVYDPIVQGIEGAPIYGQFLKDYQPTNW